MSFHKIKIFSDRKYLEEGQSHEYIFYPFWGENPENLDDPDAGRFDVYTREGKRYFTMTSLADCDFAILPGGYIPRGVKVQQLAREAKKFGKSVIIFFNSDSDEEIPIENSYIFRTSFYRSARKSNEFALPGWSADFIKRYFASRLPRRQKSKKPIVSFCGYCPVDQIRSQAINLLAKSPLVKTNFIIRKEFWGGALQDGQLNLKLAGKVRKEYVDNLVDGDYVLCTRGGGNFSYRLYETLSCGRIPLLVDTDCVLPYENWIDWQKICLWVEAKNINSIAEKVFRFHQALSAEQFRQLQQTCREIWEEWLSPQGFFKNFYRHFNTCEVTE